jgi:hypothetical protein
LLTDEQVLSIAGAYVRKRSGKDWIPVRPFTLHEPAGAFFWVELVDGSEHLDGPAPFFVFANTGRVVQFTNSTVADALDKLIATQRAFVLALFEPHFTGAGHEHAYVAFVMDCLGASAAVDP